MAQTFPQAISTTVMANPDGTLRAPANFWTANEAAILALLPPPEHMDIPFATAAQAITGTSTNLVMNPANTKAAFEAWVSTGGGTGGGLQAEWLAFNLDKVEGLWLDYELKGSPTNYGIAGQPVLPLYYHSSDPGREIITSQTGPKPLSYFMDTGGHDSRRMVQQDSTRSIWAMAKGYVGGVNAYLRVSDLQALSPGANPANWVWSYCRMSATDYERDANGHVIWRPIVPVPVSAALVAAQTGTGGDLVAEYATGGGVDPPVPPVEPPPTEGWSVQPDITYDGPLSSLALFPETTPVAQGEDLSYTFHKVGLVQPGNRSGANFINATIGTGLGFEKDFFAVSSTLTPVQPNYATMQAAQRRVNLLEYYSTGGMTLSASFTMTAVPASEGVKLFGFAIPLRQGLYQSPVSELTYYDAPAFMPYYVEARRVAGEGNENKVSIHFVRTAGTDERYLNSQSVISMRRHVTGGSLISIGGGQYAYSPHPAVTVATLATVNLGDTCVLSIVSGAEPTRVFFNGGLKSVATSDTTYRDYLKGLVSFPEGSLGRLPKYPWFFSSTVYQNYLGESYYSAQHHPMRAHFTDSTSVLWTSLRVRDRWLSDSEVAELSAGQSEGITLYTLSFDSAGGSAVASQVTTGNVTRPANPTRTGYDFVDWMTTDGGSAPFDFTSPITANATAYAKWATITRTLTFDSQGGSAVASQTVGYGQTWTRPADPTRSGYLFVNWMTTAGGNITFSFGQMPSANATAYAKWATPVTLTFDANGGSAVDPIVTVAGSVFQLPKATSRFGHYLRGWRNSAGTVLTSASVNAPATNTTYTAEWVTGFSLVFDAHGGTAVDTQYVRKASDSLDSLTGTPTFPVSTKPGHVLARWAKDEKGNMFGDIQSGVTYANPGDLGLRSMSAYLNVGGTLHAIWYGPGTFIVYNVVVGQNLADTAPAYVTQTATAFEWFATLSSSSLAGLETGVKAEVYVVADNGASAGQEALVHTSTFTRTNASILNNGSGGYSLEVLTANLARGFNSKVSVPKSALISIGMNYTSGGVSAGLTGTHFHYRVKLYFNNVLFDTINSPSVHYDISM